MPRWDLTPDVSIYIEAVHRLSDLGAVVTWAANGTSQEGFDAEWRVISLVTVEGDLINRCELFDEADIDAALARFDELSRPAHAAGKRGKPSRSSASRRTSRPATGTPWREMMADDISMTIAVAWWTPASDAVGMREIANMRAIADLGAKNMTSTSLRPAGNASP